MANFRIMRKDRTERNRLRKNIREKVRYVQNKYGIDLSSEMPVPKIENFTSRKSFNQFKKNANKFLSQSTREFQFMESPTGAVVSKSELDRQDKYLKRINKNYNEQVNRLKGRPYYQGGKQVSTIDRRAEHMGSSNAMGINKPKKMGLEDIKSREGFLKKLERLERQADPDYYFKRNLRMKTNFIHALEGHYDEGEAQEIIDIIDDMDADDFFLAWASIAEINFSDYDSEGQTGEGDERSLGKLKSELERFMKKQDPDFEGF